MLVKLESGGYYDAATGRETMVYQNKAGVWSVVIQNSGHVIERSVCAGYRDREEAQAALDELMETEDVLRIAVPEAEEIDEEALVTEEGGN